MKIEEKITINKTKNKVRRGPDSEPNMRYFKIPLPKFLLKS